MIGLIQNFITIFFILLAACSAPEQAEQEKIRRQNCKGEFIHRSHDEIYYTATLPKQRTRQPYPWEEAYTGQHAKITKEFFRCKGSSLNPPKKTQEEGKEYLDCSGLQHHSLPLRDKKEFIYPILLELLNYLQTKTSKKVVITCGHRCPTHNLYADGSSLSQNSKHMIGAEVDFYLEGMESKPEEVIKLLLQFYRETPPYKDKKEYEQFQRYDKPDNTLATPPWYNKEIFIKLCRKNEGRDFDNRHPYPYLSIQVRHDRDTDEKVVCSQAAASNYLRN